jgi:autotransporter-associated beta strand protein
LDDGHTSTIAGQGTGRPQTITSSVTITSLATLDLVVGRLGAELFPYYTQAANKTIQLTSAMPVGSTKPWVITNNNGYGLETTANLALATSQNFNVVNATASNVVQGLTVSGVVSGTSSISKIGNGTLVLGNPNGSTSNTFIGSIDIQAGVVSVANNTALGNAANVVQLNANGATGVGLRATETFTATGRTIRLNQENNGIEVTAGKLLTLDTAFALTAVTNRLIKNDNGVLILAAANGTWTGGLNINAGAVRLTNATAGGSGPISVSPAASATGAALQLSGGLTFANPINLQGVNNVLFGGINFGGQVQSVSGSNTVSGPITMNFDAAMGADSGATLNITGGINNATTTGRTLAFTGWHHQSQQQSDCGHNDGQSILRPSEIRDWNSKHHHRQHRGADQQYFPFSGHGELECCGNPSRG